MIFRLASGGKTDANISGMSMQCLDTGPTLLVFCPHLRTSASRSVTSSVPDARHSRAPQVPHFRLFRCSPPADPSRPLGAEIRAHPGRLRLHSECHRLLPRHPAGGEDLSHIFEAEAAEDPTPRVLPSRNFFTHMSTLFSLASQKRSFTVASIQYICPSWTQRHLLGPPCSAILFHGLVTWTARGSNSGSPTRKHISTILSASQFK